MNPEKKIEVIEVEADLIRTIRSELINVVRDIHDRNYGLAMERVESAREKISNLHIHIG